MDCFGTYFTHVPTCDVTCVQKATEWNALVHTSHMSDVQTCDVTRVPDATEWTASVHTSHMSKPVMLFVAKCYGVDCFGTYFTHVQTCDDVYLVLRRKSSAWVPWKRRSVRSVGVFWGRQSVEALVSQRHNAPPNSGLCPCTATSAKMVRMRGFHMLVEISQPPFCECSSVFMDAHFSWSQGFMAFRDLMFVSSNFLFFTCRILEIFKIQNSLCLVFCVGWRKKLST